MKSITKEPKLLGEIDTAVRFGSDLLILGWVGDDRREFQKAIFSISKEDSVKEINREIKYERKDLLSLNLDNKLKHYGKNGFMLHFTISSEEKRILQMTNSISCSFYLSQNELIMRKNLTVHSMRKALELKAFSWVGTDKVISSLSASKALDVSFLKGVLFSSPAKLHIDQSVCVSEGGMLLSGWAADASLKEFFWIADDSENTRPVPYIEFSDRPDVSKFLSEQSTSIIAPDIQHGFTCFITFPEEFAKPKSIKLALKDEQEWQISQAISFTAEQGILNSIEEILQLACPADQIPTKKLALELSNLAKKRALKKVNPVKEVIEYGPESTENITTSIIIPFYGEYFFLNHILMMQELADSDVEWILVCDDPSIVHHFESYLKSRKSSLKQSVKLLVLKENNGFAEANNIGYAHCKGDFILLMNSDIYCDNFDWLDYGIQLIKQENISSGKQPHKIGAIGFTLQFEDGTVQHDGMCFERDSLYENVFLTTHPGKGLPANWTTLKHRTVEACTAALLLLPRHAIQGDQIFLSNYIKGDFEDSDLNLRLRKAGYEVNIVETPGIYHLERQSIKLMGSGAYRTKLTLLNCQTFNSEWSDFIDQYQTERLS